VRSDGGAAVGGGTKISVSSLSLGLQRENITETVQGEKNEAKEKHEAGAKEEDAHLRVTDIKHISETCP
jgi:hypothetical protein